MGSGHRRVAQIAIVVQFAALLRLCLPKIISGANAFGISDIQEDETEAVLMRQDRKVTMLHLVKTAEWGFRYENRWHLRDLLDDPLYHDARGLLSGVGRTSVFVSPRSPCSDPELGSRNAGLCYPEVSNIKAFG